ncbi:hypothetical protein SAMN05661096_02562 [Marivirga sericea]|uniref:Uncharacterized protein n=1 Tax=Marivirga sericea TaxID=1028 RepID=A0A1X7KCY0_9BACT|nr:hypothetical protein [Marivirga sericea]SMG38706.1 hypothetical protein SAMN05661096_02562 [Marivirga sericea]
MKPFFLLVAGICVFIIACQNQKQENLKASDKLVYENYFDFPDSLSARRISFVLNLKQDVAKKVWGDFGRKSTEGPLIYFNKDKSEIFFPNSTVNNSLVSFDKHSDDYLLTARTDSIPFHMENMLSFDTADSSEFYYNNPVEQYCSVEEIAQYIPSVESTEMWSTMVIHEMFHHYQFNNEHYKEYAKNEISPLSFNPKDLVSLCQYDEDFLPMIQNENDLLMKAISENNGASRDSLVLTYLEKRKSRIEKYRPENPDLEKVENFYLIQEGSARYIEYKSMFTLSNYIKCSDSIVILNDPMFKSYEEFKEVDLSNPNFSYLTYAGLTDYYYTIGFNTMRLLDVLLIDNKSNLLNKPQMGLHNYLEQHINTLPKRN